ncbi:MAG: hypothetical protein FD166_2379 [Bacteroidetes bacterium]|nr:MAG: hypothetical protein FD166_2379 [Bacteroidota bacterium]
MKKLILIPFFIACAVNLNGQPWKIMIQNTTDSSVVRTLKLKPKVHIGIKSLITESDSLKVTNTYGGTFLSGTRDSLTIRLEEFRVLTEYANGIKQTTTIPRDFYLKNPEAGNSVKSLALMDIDFLTCQRRPKLITRADNVIEPIILGLLFVMLISPLISYNYKEGYLNTERYKYWALGSTIGLASGFATLITINGLFNEKRIQFRPGWPEKKAKVWEFR